MTIESIKEYILRYKSEGKKMFTTSSFQTHSVVLLHMLSYIDQTIPIYFINTGYHFPETIQYKDDLVKLLGLNIQELKSAVPKILQRDSSGRLLFTFDPDYCCYLNKVQPVDFLLQSKDVWINGVRADQNSNRKNFKIEEKAAHGVTRFHPMLDWTSKMIYDYIKKYDLPKHPLDKQGYHSIGCEPCTRKAVGDDREGRWYGMNKTECGLNTDLITK